MKTLTQEQIDKIQSRARNRLNKDNLRIARDNFYNILNVLNSKSTLNKFTLEDLKDILLAFNVGCSNATSKTCSIIRKEYFIEIGNDIYEDYEFCRPCFFNQFCCARPDNRKEDGWHYNMLQLKDYIKKLSSKDEIDKNFILNKYNNIKNSSDLQELYNLVENWE